MRAVIPAAGRGTRMGELVSDRPKPLVPAAGKPLLFHLLEALLELEPEAFVLVVPERDGPVRDRVGDAFAGVPVRYVVQRRPSGLAHAVLAAEGRVDGPFVVANGDNVFRAELSAPWRRLRDEGRDAVLLTERVPAERARQGVCVTGPDGRLRRIVEHPPDALTGGGGEREVVAGFYAFTPAVFDACRGLDAPAGEEYELSDAVNLMIDAGREVVREPLSGWRVNVNTPADLAEAERRLEARA